MSFRLESSVYCNQYPVQSFEIYHHIAGKRNDAAEILFTEIDPLLSFNISKKRKTVRTADNRPLPVDKTAVVQEQRTRALFPPIGSAGKELFYLRRKLPDRIRQICSFDREKVQVAAAVAATGPAEYFSCEVCSYLRAKLVDSFQKCAVIRKDF